MPLPPRPRRKARVIARPTLNEYKAEYPDAAEALDNWEDAITSITFSSFEELNQQINTVDLVNGVFLVFNIMGGRFRLITGVFWGGPDIYLKLFLKHKDYDVWSDSQRTKQAKNAARELKKGAKKDEES